MLELVELTLDSELGLSLLTLPAGLKVEAVILKQKMLNLDLPSLLLLGSRHCLKSDVRLPLK